MTGELNSSTNLQQILTANQVSNGPARTSASHGQFNVLGSNLQYPKQSLTFTGPAVSTHRTFYAPIPRTTPKALKCWNSSPLERKSSQPFPAFPASTARSKAVLPKRGSFVELRISRKKAMQGGAWEFWKYTKNNDVTKSSTSFTLKPRN